MDTSATVETPDKMGLGPSIVYPISHIIASRWFYVGVALIVLPCVLHNFNWSLAALAPQDAAMAGSSGFDSSKLRLDLISAFVGLLLVASVVMNSVFNYVVISYDYTTQPRPLLYLTSGMLNRTIDNIDLSIVVDCDISRHPLDFLFGTGNLTIRTIDGQIFRMLAVENVFVARDLILAQRPLAAAIRRG
jgi:hypothetical protein